MNERTTKMLLVVLGLGVPAGIIAWRNATTPEVEAVAAPVDDAVTVVTSSPAPEGIRGADIYGLTSVEGLAAEKVATIEVHNTRANLEKNRRSDTTYEPIRQKELELGSNANLKGEVEDVPGQPGAAKMKVELWLVHSGPFPKAKVTEQHQRVCVVTKVDPTGDAFAGGLRAGDVWVQVQDTDALATPSPKPCAALTETSRGTAVGSEVKFGVYRGGARQDLMVKKNGPMLKFESMNAPVLDADQS